MNNSRTIKTLIRSLADTSKMTDAKNIDCIVVSVNESKRSCIVNSQDGNIEDLEVRLLPSISDGELDLPAVDSNVVVSVGEGFEPHIVSKSFIDKKLIIVGDQSFKIEPDKITLNDGGYGGLIIIEKLVKKINDLEDKYNDLVQKFNTHIHITTATIGTGGPGTIAPTTTTETPISQKTKRDDFENESIVHGKDLQ